MPGALFVLKIPILRVLLKQYGSPPAPTKLKSATIILLHFLNKEQLELLIPWSCSYMCNLPRPGSTPWADMTEKPKHNAIHSACCFLIWRRSPLEKVSLHDLFLPILDPTWMKIRIQVQIRDNIGRKRQGSDLVLWQKTLNSKMQCDNTDMPPKLRLHNDCGPPTDGWLE